MKTRGLIAEAVEKWGVKLSRHQTYRAKRKALEMIQGAGSEQYHHLRSYAKELKGRNPNNTIIIKCNMSNEGPVFERIYVCFEACKAAFVYTCRPLIGLDGCFLKGEHGVQLLTAVGNDGNNQMIPIAFAVVEAETKDSWSWFIDLLLEDFGGIGEKKYQGIEMKEALWSVARDTAVPAWQRAMDKLKGMNENAWNDMMQMPPPTWSRSAYNTYSKCDLQVNNMCEAFNRVILEYRDKPIITLIEGLKFYITNRIVSQCDLMLRYRGNICPVIQQLLEKNKRDADGRSPHWVGDDDYSLFVVARDIDRCVVNISESSCACRKWDLTSIPCCHAIACMWHNNYAPKDYVSIHYRKTTFLATYSHIIMPSNGPKLWPVMDTLPINPPHMRRAPGRPKKQRRKTNDEPRNPHKLKRQYKTVKCKKCGKLGHNMRTCKGKTTADKTIPKGGNKTQMKHNAAATAQFVVLTATQTEVSVHAPQTQASQVNTA